MRIVVLFLLLVASFLNGFGQARDQRNPASIPDTIITHHTELVSFIFTPDTNITSTEWSAPGARREHFNLEPTVVEEEQQVGKNSSSKKNSAVRSFAHDVSFAYAFTEFLTLNSEGHSFDASFSKKTFPKRYLLIQVFRV